MKYQNKLLILLLIIAILIDALGVNYIITNIHPPLISTSVNRYCTPDFNVDVSNVHEEMESLYLCKISDIFSNINYHEIILPEMKTRSEINNSIFNNKLNSEVEFYKGMNYTLVFMSEMNNDLPNLDKFQLHSINPNHEDLSASMIRTNQINESIRYLPPSVKGIFVENNGKYRLLTESLLLQITGHSTPTEIVNFLQLRHKLLGLNSNIAEQSTNATEKPLFFVNDYMFTNHDGDVMKFQCTEKWDADLKMEFSNNSVIYYAHEGGNTNYKILKISVNFDFDNPITLIEEVLNCKPAKTIKDLDFGIVC